MRYDAVIFDFDYTLGDDTDTIYAGFVHGFAALGRPAPQREAVRRTVGMPLEDAYTLLSGDGDEGARRAFRAAFLEQTLPMRENGAPLCPGAAELLSALVAAEVKTAVVSTKHTATLEKILTRHELHKTLALIVGGDRVERSKPDPEGLLMAMEALGAAAERTLYCGDTVIDAETAQRAGADFCAVLNGPTPAEAFANYPKVCTVEHLDELRRFLAP